MKNYYTLKANQRIYPGLTFVQVTLDKSGKWCVATSSPMKFNSPEHASRYWTSTEIHGPQLGSDGMPYIVGPKNGYYPVKIIR